MRTQARAMPAIIACVLSVLGVGDYAPARAGAEERPAAGAPAAPQERGLAAPRPVLEGPKRDGWPFTAWSYAKAYTYNFFEDRHVPLRIVSDEGQWSPHIRSEQVISRDDASTAARLVAQSKGSFETTKCTFPRHAVVFFDAAEKPIASASVCFDCEGILVWPEYASSQDTYDEEAEGRFLSSLEEWRALFRDRLGLPLTFKE